MRRNVFRQRVVNQWNSLPPKAVEAKSIDIFKAENDRFLINTGVRGYRVIGRGQENGVRRERWISQD